MTGAKLRGLGERNDQIQTSRRFRNTFNSAEAHGIDGREVAVRPWSAACMPDQGPSVCDEPTRFRGTIGDHAGKNASLSPELNARHRNGGDKPYIDWPANMILG